MNNKKNNVPKVKKQLQLKNSEALMLLNIAMNIMSMNILRNDGIKIREIVFSVINISSLVYGLMFGACFLLNRSDVAEMISSLTTFNIVLSVFIRLTTLIVYSNEIKKLTCFVKEYFTPYYQNDEKFIKILEVSDKRAKHFFLFFGTMLITVIGSYIIYPSISSNMLIIPMEGLGKIVPDHYKYSLIINFSYQSYTLIYFSLVVLCYDTFIILLMLNGGAFLDILLDNIKSNRIIFESEESINIYNNNLKSILKQHQLIITYVLENKFEL